MDQSSEKRLVDALERWVNRHSRPDQPILQMLSASHSLSPSQIVQEIKAGSPIGRELLDLFDSASDDVDEVIASLDREAHSKAHGRSGAFFA